jgi:precorrin-6A/cobalt-precorrin-6A reductase
MDTIDGKPLRVLLLGGTSEAAALAERLSATPGRTATLSLAGRTAKPAASPVAVRIGGFGGIAGLDEYLAREDIDAVIDATHPFAAAISANAVAACGQCGVPLLAVERLPWQKVAGDDWHEHPTIESAIAALPQEPHRIFSALGRSTVGALCLAPQHQYVIRVVDPISPPPELRNATIIAARGPFQTADDAALFRQHGIDIVLAKNSGGDAAYAKLEAARLLGLKVHIVRRPVIAKRAMVHSVDEAMVWIAAHRSPLADRGV